MFHIKYRPCRAEFIVLLQDFEAKTPHSTTVYYVSADLQTIYIRNKGWEQTSKTDNIVSYSYYMYCISACNNQDAKYITKHSISLTMAQHCVLRVAPSHVSITTQRVCITSLVTGTI